VGVDVHPVGRLLEQHHVELSIRERTRAVHPAPVGVGAYLRAVVEAHRVPREPGVGESRLQIGKGDVHCPGVPLLVNVVLGLAHRAGQPVDRRADPMPDLP
jgi:hypothetical protein